MGHSGIHVFYEESEAFKAANGQEQHAGVTAYPINLGTFLSTLNTEIY